MKKPVGSRFGQMVIQNSPFVQISSIYRKTGRESRKLVLKTGFEEMEHDLSGRFTGKFPVATERLKRQYCFPGRNVPHGDLWSITPKPSFIRVSERLSRSFCSKWN